MGLKFFENAGGLKMFFCTNCDTYLADKGHLVSTSFTGKIQCFLTGRSMKICKNCRNKQEISCFSLKIFIHIYVKILIYDYAPKLRLRVLFSLKIPKIFQS